MQSTRSSKLATHPSSLPAQLLSNLTLRSRLRPPLNRSRSTIHSHWPPACIRGRPILCMGCVYADWLYLSPSEATNPGGQTHGQVISELTGIKVLQTFLRHGCCRGLVAFLSPTSGGSSSNSAALRRRRSFSWAETVNSYRIRAGWIMLEGSVERNYQRERAEEAVRYLRGVKGVTNLIQHYCRQSCV